MALIDVLRVADLAANQPRSKANRELQHADADALGHQEMAHFMEQDEKAKDDDGDENARDHVCS